MLCYSICIRTVHKMSCLKHAKHTYTQIRGEYSQNQSGRTIVYYLRYFIYLLAYLLILYTDYKAIVVIPPKNIIFLYIPNRKQRRKTPRVGYDFVVDWVPRENSAQAGKLLLPDWAKQYRFISNIFPELYRNHSKFYRKYFEVDRNMSDFHDAMQTYHGSQIIG